MKFFLKFVLKTTLPVIFISQTCMTQELPASIKNAWGDLKMQLHNRTDIVFALSTTFSKLNEADQNELVKIRNLATDLNNNLDSLTNLDSISVPYTNTLNSRLTQALARALVTLERDTTFKNSDPVRSLLNQLDAVEKRIAEARRNYNTACLDEGRRDLFIRSNEYDNTPKLRF